MSSRPNGTKQVTILRQDVGRTHHDVQLLPSEDSRYEIQTPSAVIRVRGTTFTVDVDADGLTQVDVTEGIVDVTYQGNTVVLEAGQGITVAPRVQPVTAESPSSQPTSTSVPPLDEGISTETVPASAPTATSTPIRPELTQPQQPTEPPPDVQPPTEPPPQPSSPEPAEPPPEKTKKPKETPPGHLNTPEPPGQEKTPEPPGKDKTTQPPKPDNSANQGNSNRSRK